jgi:multiple sugar transport system permease protein
MLESPGGFMTSTTPRKRGRSLATTEAIWGYGFISLWVIGFLIFYFFPMIASFVFTLFDFTLTEPDKAKFIGLANWKRLLFDDPLVWSGLWVTFKFAFISLPIGMLTALFIAVLLNSKHLIARDLFRTLFYAPTMVPAVASLLIWSGYLNPTTGWLNRLIEFIFGFDASSAQGIRWFDDQNLVYIAYTLMGIWGIGNAILYYLASLQSVPSELYEAASIDGASWFRQLWNITLPMISPVIFYNLVLSVIGLLQFFITPYILNGGSGYPNGSTYFYMIHFFKQAFGFLNMGYGATIAWFMFLIALLITLVLFGTSRRWVYYAGGDK